MPTELPPGPRYPSPVTLYLSQRRTKDFLVNAGKEFGDLFTVRLPGGRRMVFVANPDMIKEVLTAPSEVLVGDKGAQVLVGAKSVLTVSGPEHAAARKLLMPPLTADHVQHFRDLIDRACAEQFERWPLRQPVALFPNLEKIALNVILGSVFGEEGVGNLPEIRARLSDMLATRDKPIVIAMMMILPPGTKPPDRIVKTAPFHAVIMDAINRARNDPNLAERDDIMSMLLRARHEDGSEPTQDEMRDHVITMLVQGHQSVAITLGWAVERLARHPEVVERLRSDLQGGSREYLDAVIKEVLRLRPPVPVIVREVAQPFRLGEYELPPRTRIACNGFAVHLREDIYPDPHRFKPERFLDEKPGSFTWIPFGGGVRYCVGRNFADHEVGLVLSKLVQQFRFAPAIQGDEGIRRRGIQWAPKEGAQVILQERVAAPVSA